ncbi:LPS export ABC transporter periplasmic protein LptC [Campylobacter sp. RM12327]|uniref:LPS export ABC transporter periplasmic protein LptC n=2 Tax=Campylobacter sputorum TaxID=206 RepID=UPI000B76E847|nr:MULTISPECIES: LPS export ABC transporter periplasmic protein LptC [Campylobacter]ASM40650.1 putative lipooligosaccharide transport system, substrate-binding component (LptC family) [Campylobacter sputorum]MBE7357685.1 LPS export ABC transporter periplasmic protein LptC [Campylobacter sp. RM11302]MBF6668963.1 LPS export ABC transporter periplasmic protein LptC [Campylobacter sp. RM12327]MBF6674028.1 LPS export ABC transporter periplasmic protein LptC [Campylobacter sp. RM13538]MBF6677196.1 L
MVIKIFYFVIALFSVSMALIAFQSPYLKQISKIEVGIASMQMNGIKNYEINSSGINGLYEATKALRINDDDYFYDFKGKILRDDTVHNLRSDEGIYKKDEVIFKKNAFYENSNNLNFSSQEIIYDIKSGIVKSDVDFVATQNKDKIIGKSVKYDTKNKQIYAKGVHSWINLK